MYMNKNITNPQDSSKTGVYPAKDDDTHLRTANGNEDSELLRNIRRAGERERSK